MRVGSATSASTVYDAIVRCDRLELGVPYWDQLLQVVDPTFCGSRFSTGRLLAIELSRRWYLYFILMVPPA